jgi:hypothetical protein
MTTNSKMNRDERNLADQNLMAGLTSKQQTLSSFMFGNTTHTTADIIATLQERIKTADAVDPPRAAWRTAVKANRDLRATTDPIIAGVRQTLQTMFAGSIDTLAEFGLKPRKVPAALSPDEKAAAVLKAKATRKARMTMGPKQKAKIKGAAPQAEPATLPPAAAPRS